MGDSGTIEVSFKRKGADGHERISFRKPTNEDQLQYLNSFASNTGIGDRTELVRGMIESTTFPSIDSIPPILLARCVDPVFLSVFDSYGVEKSVTSGN